MTKRPPLIEVSSKTDYTNLNTNFNRIEEAFDNLVSRDGSVPNQMDADLDLNSNDILNVKMLDTASLKVNGVAVTAPAPDLGETYYAYATVADLLAATEKPRGVGSIWQGGGFRYEEALSTATDHHRTTAGGVKLYVLRDSAGRYNLEAFGAPLDGVSNDTPTLKTAIDALKVGGIRDTTPIIVVPPGKTLRLATSCAIDGGSITLEGYGASIQYVATNAIDIGAASYLTDIAAGLFSFILRGFNGVASSGVTAIRNRGYRKVWIDDTYCVGGATFFDTEGAYAGAGARRVRIQNTSGSTWIIRQRNNNFTFHDTTTTGAGAPAVHLTTSGAELKGIQWVGRNDIEGSAGGVLIEGQSAVIGLDGLWFENNTVYNIRINNTSGQPNKDAISITRCNITGAGVDVEIGTDTAGSEINGVVIYGNEFADSDLVVIGNNKARNVEIGTNRLSGTAVYTLPTQTSMINDSVTLPVYQNMPLHSTAPVPPSESSDTKGLVGELRWESGEAWIKTPDGWMYWQMGFQGNGALTNLPTGTTPSVSGRHKVKTNNTGGATTVTDLTNGKAGQELMIYGLDGGNTTIAHGTNIRLAGGANFTLGDNDVLVLLCRDGTVWAEVSRSNNT